MKFAALLLDTKRCIRRFLLLGLLFITAPSIAQDANRRTDSHAYRKNSIWGNSTFLAAGFTHAAHDDLTFDVGRANIDASEIAWYSRTYGIGYSRLLTGKDNNYYKLFYEMSLAFRFIGFNARAEVLTNNAWSRCYIRPYVGLTFYMHTTPGIQMDVQYSYAFLLNAKDNTFNNGITARVKLFLDHKKRWNYTPMP